MAPARLFTLRNPATYYARYPSYRRGPAAGPSLSRFHAGIIHCVGSALPEAAAAALRRLPTGDQVEIELDTLVKRLPWTSLIVDDGLLADGTLFFVDEGQTLPPPLRYWRHRHLIQPGPQGGSIIVDDLEYRTATPALDALLYPAIWAQFAWRKPIYRRWFR